MLYYDEVFKSIQGEGIDSGIPTIFIRLFGCPIRCSYCDQPQPKTSRKKISLENLMTKVRKIKGATHVCITGGEPLIYEDTLPLVYELGYNGYKVSIETSGCIPIEKCQYNRSYKYVMDIKCPSSGVSEKNIYENLMHLKNNDEVKFVIANLEDYDFMKKIIKSYPCTAKILVSPMFEKDNTISKGCKNLVDWLLEDNLDVKVQIQMHKVLGVK